MSEFSKLNINNVDFNVKDETARNNITNIKNQINGLSSGSPLVASSIEEMTDTTKIYVNTTDGNWYYYNDSEWKIGGVYQSSQDIISIYGTVINASNYSELLPDLDNALETNTYSLLFAHGTTEEEMPLNIPVAPNGAIENLIVIKTGAIIKQIYLSERKAFQRYKYHENNWSSWHCVDNVYPYIISAGNYEKLLPDVNNINETTVYNMLFGVGSTKLPANLPENGDGDITTLVTMKMTGQSAYLVQIYISRSKIFYRRKYNGEWSIWSNPTNVNNKMINAGNYETVLPDLNKITKESIIYTLLFAANSESLPANLPVEPKGKIETLIHYAFTGNHKIQIYYTLNNIYYRFCYSGTWQAWVSYKDEILKEVDTPKIIYVGENEQYTKLKEAIEYATQFYDSKIYVKKGTYDLYEEFGEEFFTNYDSSSAKGLILKNRVHLIFSSNSKVVFNYTGDNQNVKNLFSPFNAGVNGFILENCKIESSGCRYAIHDERGGSADQYINKYINCNILHNNSSGGYTRCLGGGLGKNGEINIENCVFDNPNIANNVGLVSYHNDNSATSTDSKSNVIIKDNYFKKGTVRISWCGVSTEVTNVLITNNYLKNDIIHIAERTTDTIENTNVLAWNNTIE